MKRSLFLFFTLLATAFIIEVKAERYYYFDHITTADGLPSNTIYCTLQDKSGFIWTGTRDGLTRYDGNTFRNMRDIVKGDTIGGNVFSICEDAEGQIWFSTPSGVNVFNPYTGNLTCLGMVGESASFVMESDPKGIVWIIGKDLFRFDCKSLNRKSYTFEGTTPSGVAVDSYGIVWVAMDDGTLHSYDARTDKFERRHCDHAITHIEPAEDGRIIVTTSDKEVMYLDCITMDSELLFKADRNTNIRCIIERKKGECWIGTNLGLFIRRSGTNYMGEAFHDDATPKSISANYVTSLGKDKDGNVWVGTYYRGINLWRNLENEIGIYFPNPSDNSIKGDIVRSICQDSRGQIWSCTEDGWLNRLNPADQQMKAYKLAESLNLQGLIVDQDRLWICSYGQGLWIFDMINEKVLKHYSLENNTTTFGIKSAEGTIFIGTSSGLYRYDSAGNSFSLIESTRGNFIHSLYQDSTGTIWIGTYGNGILQIAEDGTLIGQHTVSEKDGSLSSRFITSFHEDSRHRMWITTEGGGVCYTDMDVPYFHNLTTEDGLPSNVTCAVVEDQEGMLWISTTNGIICLSDDNITLSGYQFSHNAACTTKSDVFYFGNIGGMISIVPSRIKAKTHTENLVITEIRARNSDRYIPLNEKGRSAMCSDVVRVKHRDASSIYIGFVAPEYSNRKPLYSYTLTKGNNQIVSESTYDNYVVFAGLSSGKYTFKVGLVGKGGYPESEKSFEIRIIPHPLASNTAIILYAILAAAILAGFVVMADLNRKKDRARQLSRMVSEREKEIYSAKINFFTNITHEIRTPLTLIKMPIDKIISTGAYNSSNEKELRIIQANTDRLLHLTNMLLDMRKMENQEMTMSFVKEDLCAIVRKGQRLFEQMVHDQHITVRTEIPDTPIYIMCAKDSILTIVSNLMSNAVKYGDGLINIKVVQSEDGQSATVRIESNGEIIPAHDRENIFKIFFQREGASKGAQGTGIGLPYARTLANMHNGHLYIDEAVTELNSFVLEIPVNQPEQITIEQASADVKDGDTMPLKFDSSRHTILITEDSSEMRSYLAMELSAEYNILTAGNGADALEILKNNKVDLVISDIMMPIMDGCELCNKIKSDSDLSHVPVILLTAAVGVETRIETLESGADGYIEKPFPIELLMSNITNLFRNKEISYRQFISKPLTHYNSVTASKVDQEYMDKIHDFIMKHISEPDLNIENLTMQVGTSKSSLYRKLKANTGLSINEYIRLCRLKQAAELLSSQKYKINEVAFMTGFSSASYFATCFLKQFNITPSEFVKNLGE